MRPAPSPSRDAARLAIVCNRSAGRVDGIRDYSRCLVQALEATGRVHADLYLRSSARSESLAGALRAYNAVVLQYNPFMYGPRGVAPWLPLELWKLARAPGGPRVAVMVHEPFVPPIHWRWRVLGAWQRLQLAAVLLSAETVFVSIEPWARMLAHRWGHKGCHHLPVGSNLPDRRDAREAERRRMGIDERVIVLTSFSTGHPSQLTDAVVRSANALRRSGHQVRVLNLGAGASPTAGLDVGIGLDQPGSQAAEVVARQLATADVFLAPFVDGASTRRTTLMAGLQHGLPTVATYGVHTDSALIRAGDAIRLVPAGNVDRFAQAVVELALDPRQRTRMGLAARRLYATTFDWPVIAGRLLEGLRLRRPAVINEPQVARIVGP